MGFYKKKVVNGIRFPPSLNSIAPVSLHQKSLTRYVKHQMEYEYYNYLK